MITNICGEGGGGGGGRRGGGKGDGLKRGRDSAIKPHYYIVIFMYKVRVSDLGQPVLKKTWLPAIIHLHKTTYTCTL